MGVDDVFSFGQGLVWSSGKEQNFDGNNKISVSSMVTVKGHYTISAWVFPTTRLTDWARIIGKGSKADFHTGFIGTIKKAQVFNYAMGVDDIHSSMI